MQYLLGVLVGVAAYAGYKGWPLYTIFPVGGALVIWHLMYFGTQAMQLATGGALAYILRISIINTIQATAFYGAGVGLHYLIGCARAAWSGSRRAISDRAASIRCFTASSSGWSWSIKLPN